MHQAPERPQALLTFSPSPIRIRYRGWVWVGEVRRASGRLGARRMCVTQASLNPVWCNLMVNLVRRKSKLCHGHQLMIQTLPLCFLSQTPNLLYDGVEENNSDSTMGMARWWMIMPTRPPGIVFEAPSDTLQWLVNTGSVYGRIWVCTCTCTYLTTW